MNNKTSEFFGASRLSCGNDQVDLIQNEQWATLPGTLAEHMDILIHSLHIISVGPPTEEKIEIRDPHPEKSEEGT